MTTIVWAGACIGCDGCAVASSGAYRIRFNRLGIHQAERKADELTPADESRISAVCPFSDQAETEDLGPNQ